MGCFVGESRDSGWKDKVRNPSPYRKVRGANFVHQWKDNFTGKYRSRVWARTEAEHWKNNMWGVWTWLPYEAKKVSVEIWLTRYKETDCAVQEYFHAYGSKEGKENVELQFTQDGHFGWDGITTRHILETNDGYPPVELVIDTRVCP